jgi:hypothetical protein
MELETDFIYNIEQKINQTEDDIFFYSLMIANKIDVNYICKPYSNSILEKYNTYFGTNHTYETIKANNKFNNFICLHTFVIPTNIFIKMMDWYCLITDWLHKNYINGLYTESISKITEEIFGLFLLLQMIENDNIVLYSLKLNHEWPKLHNETEWTNYKVPMPLNIVNKKNDNKLCFDIGANIGNWSLKNMNNYDKIITIEASETTFKKLLQNVSNNRTIIPLNYAVCNSKEEHIKFYNCESDVLSTINEKWLNILNILEKTKKVIVFLTLLTCYNVIILQWYNGSDEVF